MKSPLRDSLSEIKDDNSIIQRIESYTNLEATSPGLVSESPMNLLKNTSIISKRKSLLNSFRYEPNRDADLSESTKHSIKSPSIRNTYIVLPKTSDTSKTEIVLESHLSSISCSQDSNLSLLNSLETNSFGLTPNANSLELTDVLHARMPSVSNSDVDSVSRVGIESQEMTDASSIGNSQNSDWVSDFQSGDTSNCNTELVDQRNENRDTTERSTCTNNILAENVRCNQTDSPSRLNFLSLSSSSLFRENINNTPNPVDSTAVIASPYFATAISPVEKQVGNQLFFFILSFELVKIALLHSFMVYFFLCSDVYNYHVLS